MPNVFAIFLALVSAVPPQPAAKLVPYVYSPAAPADLSGTWTVDPKRSAGLYRSLTDPAERVFAATVEYRSASARTREGDVLLRVYPVARPNSGTYIYGNLRTRAYWYPGYRCTGDFLMEQQTRQVTEWRGLCRQGRERQAVPLRLVRS